MRLILCAKIIKKSLQGTLITVIFNNILSIIGRRTVVLKILSSFFCFFAFYQLKKK